MAPEVITAREYGFESDTYALAITIWELFHKKCVYLITLGIMCSRQPYYELGNEWFANLNQITNGVRPTISSETMDESCSLFVQRYVVLWRLLSLSLMCLDAGTQTSLIDRD